MPQAKCWWEDNAQDVAELCEAYLYPLHDWQVDVLACWLAEDDTGKYLAKTCGLLVPRQNGKTALIAARILYGLLFANNGKGERIRYSAHRVDTTLEMFELMLGVFGDSRKPADEWAYPDLHALVEKENFTNGHQAIKLLSGAEVRFSARSTGASRGFTLDLQIFDEAGFLTDAQLSASKSTTSAAPSGNPQTIYAGTPPNEQGVYAEPFGRVKANANAGFDTVCWHEWSIGDYEPYMLSDRDVWAACNPSLGLNLLWDAVESEFVDMSPDTFAIERLCWWPETASANAFNAEKWEKTTVDDAPHECDIARKAIGVKFAPGGLQMCVAGAMLVHGANSDIVHTELVENRNTLDGVQWLVDSLIVKQSEIAAVFIDGKAGAQNLAGMLIRAGFSKRGVHVMGSADVVTATTMTVNTLAEGRLTHLDDAVLDSSVRNSTKRRIGTDGYGLGGDCCAAEAMCAAVLAAVTTKRNPKRKQMIG